MPNETLVLAATESFATRLVQRLRQDGRPTRFVSDAAEAARAVRESSIDLVIAEPSVPEVDAKTRSQILAARPGCRIIFLSSLEQLKDAGTLLLDGSAGYFVRDGDLSSLTQSESSSTPGSTARTDALRKLLELVVSLNESADEYFAGFSSKVTRLAEAVAEEMQIDESSREDIAIACLVRDVGKAGIREDVVNQPDTLAPEEIDHMREHVLWSVRLIEHIDFGGKIVPLVRHHHERYDGTGYPDGLKGRQIPVGARIIAAAEAFLAMTSARPHRRSHSTDDALEEMVACSGTQFDPEIVEALTRVLRSHRRAVLGGRRLILVVDPERESRRLLRMRLSNEGYEVVATATFADDILPPMSATPQLVVCAASDGGDEAFRALGRLREHDEGQGLPFALLAPDDDPRLRMRALEHGVDEILNKSGPLQEIVARIKNVFIREDARARQRHDHQAVGISGNLRNLSVTDITQMLCMGQKTASVTLDGPRGSGSIWFRDGKLVHAEEGSATGENAFRELLSWDDATFLIRHGQTPTTESMDTDPMSILLKHFSLVDEVSDHIESGLRLDMSAGEAATG